MTRAFAILLTVVSLAAAVYLWRERDALETEYAATQAARAEESRAEQNGGVSASGRSTTMLRAATVVPAPTPPRVTLSADMRQLRERRGYRDLYERLSALANPTPEQQYILYEIANTCSGQQQRQQARVAQKAANDPAAVRAEFAATISAKDPNRDLRLAAYDRALTGPCDGLQLAAGSAKGLLDAAAAAGDPKALARQLQQEIWSAAARKPGDATPGLSDSQLQRVRQLTANDDPVAAMAAMHLLGQSFANYSLRVGPNEAPLDPMTFHHAIELLGCDLGLDCGPNSIAIAQACAYQNNCDARDLRELVMTYQVPAGRTGMVDEYMQALRRARAGDWSSFTVVNGPSPQGALFNRR